MNVTCGEGGMRMGAFAHQEVMMYSSLYFQIQPFTWPLYYHLHAEVEVLSIFPTSLTFSLCDLAGQHLIKLHFLSLCFRYYDAAPFKR